MNCDCGHCDLCGRHEAPDPFDWLLAGLMLALIVLSVVGY